MPLLAAYANPPVYKSSILTFLFYWHTTNIYAFYYLPISFIRKLCNPYQNVSTPDMLSYVDTKLIRTCLAFQELPLEKREKKSCYLSRGIVVSRFFLTNMSR